MLSDEKVREEAVALISEEVQLSEKQAEMVWDAVVLAVKRDPKSVAGRHFQSARYQPPSGRTLDGVERVRLIAGNSKTV